MDFTTFLNYIKYEKRYSPHTLLAYKNDLQQFSDFLCYTYNITTPTLVTKDIIRSWMYELLKAKIQHSSIHRKISTLNTYYKFLQKKSVLSINPITNISLPKKNKTLIGTVEQQNMAKLFDVVKFKDKFSGIRDKILLEILYNTGMRRSELINLKNSDISFNPMQFKVLGKGNKERIIPYSIRLKEIIEEYLSKRREAFPKNKTVFFLLTNKGKQLYPKLVYNIAKKYLEQVTTVVRKSPHIFRHSFATHLMDNDADMNIVKELLGHSSLASTQIYTHTSINRLKKVYEKAHPKSKIIE